MEKIDIKLFTFPKVINVHSYASAINKKSAAFDSEIMAASVKDEINVAHLAWSSVCNWSPSEFEHMCRKAASQSGCNDARKAVYLAMEDFVSDINGVFEKFKDNNTAASSQLLKKIEDALCEWRIATTASGSAPSLFVGQTMTMTDDTVVPLGETDIGDVENLALDSGTWNIVPSKSKKKVSNPASSGKFESIFYNIDLPRVEHHADVDVTEPHPPVDDSGTVNIDGGVFPPSAVRMLSYVYEPGFNAPYVKDQRIQLKDISNFAMTQIEWKPVKKAVFYKTSLTNVYGVKAMFDRGLISPSMYLIAVAKAPETFSEMVSFTHDECIENGATEGQLRCAILEYQKAQSIRMLKDAKLDNKVSFVETWYDRLKDIVDDIDSTICGHMFKASLKRAMKNSSPGKEVNRAFYSFKLGQIAIWKKGKTRVEVIQDSMPAVTYFWKDQASMYVDLWKASPLSQYNMRSSYGKLSTDARRIYQESKLKAKATINAAKNLSQEGLKLASEAIAEEQQVFEALADGLSFTERARLRFSRAWTASRKGANYLLNFKPEAESQIAKVKTRFSQSLEKVSGFFTRIWLRHEVVATTISESANGDPIIVERSADMPTYFNIIVGYIPRKLGSGVTSAVRWLGRVFNQDVVRAVSENLE